MSKVRCTNCNDRCREETPAAIPYAVYEIERARDERMFLKLWIVIIVLIAVLIGSNIGWLIYEAQFETVETVEEVDIKSEENGIANYIGEDGNIYNGSDYGKENNENSPT